MKLISEENQTPIVESKCYSDYVRKTIKERRLELKLTAKEAADIADVSTEEWKKYEEGFFSPDSFPEFGICKALKWVRMECDEDENAHYKSRMKLEPYMKRKFWPEHLYNHHGAIAAISFVAGSDLLMGAIAEDKAALDKRPKGSVVGDLPVSLIEWHLPREFSQRYNYGFLVKLGAAAYDLRKAAKEGKEISVNCVVDELVLLISAGLACSEFEMHEDMIGYDLQSWIYDVFGDMDIEEYLYPNEDFGKVKPLDKTELYHFDNWKKPFWNKEE